MNRAQKTLLLLVALVSLSSCSGYRLLDKSNPFAEYDIKSICLPNFYNYSNLSGIGPVFQREIYQELVRYKGLKIKGCEAKVDGVLLGVISSDRFLNQTIKTTTEGNPKFLGDPRIQSRKDFNIATVSEVGLYVDFILIKHPKAFDYKLFELGELNKIPKSKVLLKQTIPVNQSFNREIFISNDSVINNIQNRGIVKKKIIEMASSMRKSFKDLILYAF